MLLISLEAGLISLQIILEDVRSLATYVGAPTEAGRTHYIVCGHELQYPGFDVNKNTFIARLSHLLSLYHTVVHWLR